MKIFYLQSALYHYQMLPVKKERKNTLYLYSPMKYCLLNDSKISEIIFTSNLLYLCFSKL